MKFPIKTYRHLALLVPLAAVAQTAPPAAPADAATPGPSSTVTLSPFEVRTEKDEGYAASNTLSGTRLNSSLANIPASIQVLTKACSAWINSCATACAGVTVFSISFNSVQMYLNMFGLL